MRLQDLEIGKRYWLWESSEESRHHFFLRKNEDWTLELLEYTLIDTDTQNDDAWEQVDCYKCWKDAVYDWDTEDSFETFKDNMDVWDYTSCDDLYDCPDEVYSQLESQWFLNYGEYPDYYDKRDFDEGDILDLLNEDECNQELLNAIKVEYKMNTMNFIQPMPIR